MTAPAMSPRFNAKGRNPSAQAAKSRWVSDPGDSSGICRLYPAVSALTDDQLTKQPNSAPTIESFIYRPCEAAFACESDVPIVSKLNCYETTERSACFTKLAS